MYRSFLTKVASSYGYNPQKCEQHVSLVSVVLWARETYLQLITKPNLSLQCLSSSVVLYDYRILTHVIEVLVLSLS